MGQADGKIRVHTSVLIAHLRAETASCRHCCGGRCFDIWCVARIIKIASIRKCQMSRNVMYDLKAERAVQSGI